MGILLALPSDIRNYVLGEWCSITQLSLLDASTICSSLLSPLMRDMFNSNEFAVHFHTPMYSRIITKKFPIFFIWSLGYETFYGAGARLTKKLSWIKLRNVQTTELCLLKTHLDNIGAEFTPRTKQVKNLLIMDDEPGFVISTSCMSAKLLKLLEKCPNINILRIFYIRVIHQFDAPLSLDKLVILHLGKCCAAMITSIVLKSKNVEQLHLCSLLNNDKINMELVQSVSTVMKKLRYASINNVSAEVEDHFVEVVELFVNKPDSVIVELRIGRYDFNVGAGAKKPRVSGYYLNSLTDSHEDTEIRLKYARVLDIITQHKELKKGLLVFDYI